MVHVKSVHIHNSGVDCQLIAEENELRNINTTYINTLRAGVRYIHT